MAPNTDSILTAELLRECMESGRVSEHWQFAKLANHALLRETRPGQPGTLDELRATVHTSPETNGGGSCLFVWTVTNVWLCSRIATGTAAELIDAMIQAEHEMLMYHAQEAL